MLTSIIGVVVLLGGLIFFHELGHYLMAKLFGVKVEVFSLGFGKKLLTWRLGETEYALSVFPLGGYVKLMGDDPYKGVPAAEAERAFSTQKLYKRFLIVAAGPCANLLLAYCLYLLVFWFGQPMMGTRVGTVEVGSPAWEAGIRARDRIAEVSGTKVIAWSELEETLKTREGEKVELALERGNGQLKVPVVVSRVKAKNPFGEDEEVGGIKGIGPLPLAALIGVPNPKSAAFAAGLRSGDQITKIQSTPVQLWEEVNDALAADWQPGKPVVVTVRRKGVGEKDAVMEQSFNLVLPAKPAGDKVTPFGLAEAAGIYPSDVFVQKVTPNSPAEKGGLQPGDRIVKLNEKAIYNFDTIVNDVQDVGAKDQSLNLTLEREGQTVILNLKPVPSSQEDPLTRQPTKKFMVGFVPWTAYHDTELVKLRVHDPVKLFTRAANETYMLANRMVVSLVKLAIGKISVKNLGGPVLIASVAGKSLDAGIIPFLQMMALISINLFLLNLFPVPILDGGHLLFFAIEAVKGRPVSVRTMEVANQVGMVFILMLVGLTLFNDISRFVSH